MNEYIDSVKKQFEYYKLIAEKTLDQLPEDKLSWQFNSTSNSISTIVKHLSGNMLSRWYEFLISDGEKEWRNRDSEFINDIKSKEELMTIWNNGWKVLFKALDTLRLEDLSAIIYIRNQGHTVVEAINRQLAHYPYHIGQIVYIGKMICDEDWNSLSIPLEKSKDYNIENFPIQKKENIISTKLLTKKNS